MKVLLSILVSIYISSPLLASQDSEIVGMADIHNHMLSKEGFGGNFFKGDIVDLNDLDKDINLCDWVSDESHGFLSFLKKPLKTFASTKLGKKLTFLRDCYNPNSFNKQQVHLKWLKRAFDGGLKLVVIQTVHNSVLCNVVRPKKGYSCDEYEAVERQVKLANKLEKAIDEKAGGKGKGWFRIVKTPAEARSVINNGKLAVVLGLEIDFDACHGGKCDSLKLKTMIDDYYALGIRHFFITHLNDNDVGGTAMYGSRVNSLYQRFYKKNPFHVHDCSNDGYIDPNESNKRKVICNNKGLTESGKELVYHMMDKKVLIDIDHLSEKSLNQVLAITADNLYPVVGSHSGFLDTARASQRGENKKKRKHLDLIYGNGGLTAPILNTYPAKQVATNKLEYRVCDGSSNIWLSSYKYLLGYLEANNYDQAIAIGTDFNGLVHSPSPRFGEKACDGNKEQAKAQINPVRYPFKSFDGTKTFDIMKSGRKEFNYNKEGLSNVGLLPDYIEDLKQLGLSNEQIAPLFKGAEAYLSTWEKFFNFM